MYSSNGSFHAMIMKPPNGLVVASLDQTLTSLDQTLTEDLLFLVLHLSLVLLFH